MRLTPEQQEAMLRSTRRAAAALVEDLQYIREHLLNRDYPDKGEIRRFSAILRRIIIDDDLRKIAAPRIGRILLDVSDTKELVKFSRDNPIYVAALGGYHSRSLRIGLCVTMQRGSRLPDGGVKPVRMNTDGFRSQLVLCWQNKWVKRADIIKHVAIFGHGTHSEQVNTPEGHLLEFLSDNIGYTVFKLPDGDEDAFFVSGPDVMAPKKEWEQRRIILTIDIVLAQLLGAAFAIVASTDVIALEKIIHEEVDRS